MALGNFWMAAAMLAALAQGQESPHAHHAPPVVVEGGWVKYQHQTAKFSLEHPPTWNVVSEKGPGPVHIAHPTKAVHLFAAAFTMPEGTLPEFAEAKFGVQRELFAPLGPARSLDGVGWTGLVQEAEAAENGEHARRRMLCARHEKLYVSLTLYIDPKELVAPEVDYERIFTSLRFDEGFSAPGSSPPQAH